MTLREYAYQNLRRALLPLPVLGGEGWGEGLTNGVDLMAPDGVTMISHTLLRAMGQSSPQQCLQMLMNYGQQIGITDVLITPNDATRAFVTPGGTGFYSTRYNDPPPPNSTELNPYNYGH